MRREDGMGRTKADLRAALDDLGLSIREAGTVLKTGRTLQGWCNESSYGTAPDSVWEALGELRDAQEDEAAELASAAMAGRPLPYLASQAASDAIHGDGMPYAFHNSASRKAARELERRGVAFHFEYRGA